jgi:hypothetical protein
MDTKITIYLGNILLDIALATFLFSVSFTLIAFGLRVLGY